MRGICWALMSTSIRPPEISNMTRGEVECHKWVIGGGLRVALLDLIASGTFFIYTRIEFNVV